MNAQSQTSYDTTAQTPAQRLLKRSAGGLDSFAQSLRPLQKALDLARELGDAAAVKAAAKLRRQLDQFEPSVTMIGQIKSGKTTLVNAMIGWPELLPADVNPWTSVVTSLHLSPGALTPAASARFEFFGAGEWDRLVTGGGRIGELANRAGADGELTVIKAQVEMMRDKTKARLGRKFEMLLGRDHSYGYIDKELVERYVCLGDDFTEGAPTSTSQGRFADITKSADLRMQQPALPIGLCIRDTPGVNDTFMVREQITIKSIRDSRICVVVLSAHQALSSTDLALIRLISNVKSREVIVFVNRIDELSDPCVQVPQIEASIRQTLETQHGPGDCQIMFGSALWAHHASLGSIGDLPPASQQALLNWAEQGQIRGDEGGEPLAFIWDLSGLPALFGAIAERIIEGEGRELAEQVATRTANLLTGIKVADNFAAKSKVGQARVSMAHQEVLRAISDIRSGAVAELDRCLAESRAAFEGRIDRSHKSFLARATEALARHLEIHGEQSTWSYDPAGLRVLLNSGYKSFGAKAQASYTRAAAQSVTDLGRIYQGALGLAPELVDLRVPPAPQIPPPVTLGQTIALDLRSGWWKGWWKRRRSYQAQAQDFHDLIRDETQALVADLTGDQAEVICRDMRARLEAFVDDQSAMLSSLTEARIVPADKMEALLGFDGLQARDTELTHALNNLQRYCT